MPEEDKKFFDISKPKQVGPQPTSKPFIVDQQPEGSDPMIKESPETPESPTEGTNIPVTVAVPQASPEVAPTTPEPLPQMADLSAPHETSPAMTPSPPMPETTTPDPYLAGDQPPMGPGNSFSTTDGQLPETMPTNVAGQPAPSAPIPQYAPQDEIHLPAGRSAYHHKPRLWAWLLILLIILAGIYAAVDAKTDIKLPFEIFKQSSDKITDQTTNTAPQSTAPTNTLPTGFVRYQPTGTLLTFGYPTLWGTPTTATDPGFSQRGGSQKSDGAHAYLVKFATNKDVEIAITSAKYLPASRGTLYYDFLQWCVGTNDQKFYKSVLNFTSSNSIDKPSTITCDQGPLNDATKINEAVIVQAKTKDASGALLGDLYTAKISGSDLVVLRVKDAKMTNGNDIEKLLGTIAGTPNQ